MDNKKKDSSNSNIVDIDPGTLLAVVILLLFIPLILAGFMG